MGEVGERITYYINKKRKRSGTLWQGRFKSTVVEDSLDALLAVSTYIDLNPIRAGIVMRPEDYRWSGYSSALAGQKMEQDGLRWIYGDREAGETPPSWKTISKTYRIQIFERGLEVLEDESNGIIGRLEFTAEEVEKEIKLNGKIPFNEVMLYRIRYFTDGVIIGSAGFINRLNEKYQSKLSSPDSKRTTGARPMRGAEWGGLMSLRDLRLNPIGKSQ